MNTGTRHYDTNNPLMVVRGSMWATSEWSPNRILIFHDRVEEHDRGFLKRSAQTLRYDQIAQVSVRSGMMYSELRIESTGGKEWVVNGLRRTRAMDAKQLIERKIEEFHAQRNPAPRSPSAGVAGPEDFADQIRKLAMLRDEGLLTDSEFEAKKKEILDHM
ncbi:MAG TPA: SHOCT domain-containing protein [Gemmatimonadota bacterium]|nr:SHOCT domain-containing protein [Gemmatimonadota bacterium]